MPPQHQAQLSSARVVSSAYHPPCLLPRCISPSLCKALRVCLLLKTYPLFFVCVSFYVSLSQDGSRPNMFLLSEGNLGPPGSAGLCGTLG
jgi:hypothetical protein